MKAIADGAVAVVSHDFEVPYILMYVHIVFGLFKIQYQYDRVRGDRTRSAKVVVDKLF